MRTKCPSALSHVPRTVRSYRYPRCILHITHVPSSSSLMSLAAWIPSSLSAFSITLLRSRACRSSALIEQPIVLIGVCVCSRVKQYRLERHGHKHVGRHAGLRYPTEPVNRRPTRDCPTSPVVADRQRLGQIVCCPTRRPSS